MLNSVDTAFDCRIRFHLRNLLLKIWGPGRINVGNKFQLNFNVSKTQRVPLQKRKIPELSNAQVTRMPSEGKFKFIVKKSDTPKADFSIYSENSSDNILPVLVHKAEPTTPQISSIIDDFAQQPPKRVKVISDESQKELKLQISLKPKLPSVSTPPPTPPIIVIPPVSLPQQAPIQPPTQPQPQPPKDKQLLVVHIPKIRLQRQNPPSTPTITEPMETVSTPIQKAPNPLLSKIKLKIGSEYNLFLDVNKK